MERSRIYIDKCAAEDRNNRACIMAKKLLEFADRVETIMFKDDITIPLAKDMRNVANEFINNVYINKESEQ